MPGGHIVAVYYSTNQPNRGDWNEMRGKTRELITVAALFWVTMAPGIFGGVDAAPQPCNEDKGPWIVEYCITVRGGIHTSVTMTKTDSTTVSYVLFDNLLDRDCTLVLKCQPVFWQSRQPVDSLRITLPFPDAPSGIYEVKVSSGDEVSLDTLVLMK